MSRGRLHVHTWGASHRRALLLHGMIGDGRMWWEVAPALVAEGYQVLAPDLPGHGRSQPDSAVTVESTIDALISVCPDPELAIGQSLGGLVLACGAARLGVGRVVLVDTPLRLPPGQAHGETTRRLTAMKARRTFDWLRQHRPHWSDQDCEIEAEAAQHFDVATAASLIGSLGGAVQPPPGIRTLAILPEPSNYVSADDKAHLCDTGVEVRTIRGAGHTVWYGHVPQFLAALHGWI